MPYYTSLKLEFPTEGEDIYFSWRIAAAHWFSRDCPLIYKGTVVHQTRSSRQPLGPFAFMQQVMQRTARNLFIRSLAPQSDLEVGF